MLEMCSFENISMRQVAAAAAAAASNTSTNAGGCKLMVGVLCKRQRRCHKRSIEMYLSENVGVMEDAVPLFVSLCWDILYCSKFLRLKKPGVSSFFQRSFSITEKATLDGCFGVSNTF